MSKIKPNRMDFGFKFQRDTLALMLRNPNFLLTAQKYLDSEYFSSSKLRYFVSIIYKYHRKYHTIPSKIYLEENCRDEDDFKFLLMIENVKKIDEKYICESVEEFAKRSLFINVYTDSGKLYNKGEVEEAFKHAYNGMSDIQKISFGNDPVFAFFNDLDTRISLRQKIINDKRNTHIRTGIRELDQVMGGGIRPGEFGLFLGDTKAGKSVCLIHLGLAAVKRMVPTLAITLEDSLQGILASYDSAYLGMKWEDISQNKMTEEQLKLFDRMRNKRKKTDLFIHHYDEWNTFSILDLDKLVTSYRERDIEIGLITIDYLELMKSLKKYHIKEERFRQMEITRSLASFSSKSMIPIWSATQSKRQDNQNINEFLTANHSAESYDKVRAVTHFISINVTNAEYENGLARLYLDRSRRRRGKRIIRIYQDLKTVRFSIPKTQWRQIYGNVDKRVYEKQIVDKKKK